MASTGGNLFDEPVSDQREQTSPPEEPKQITLPPQQGQTDVPEEPKQITLPPQQGQTDVPEEPKQITLPPQQGQTDVPEELKQTTSPVPQTQGAEGPQSRESEKMNPFDPEASAHTIKVTWSKGADGCTYEPTDDEINRYNDKVKQKTTDPRTYILDQDAWEKIRKILSDINAANPKLNAIQLYDLIGDNSPWDTSQALFDLSKLWMSWHPDKIRGALQQSKAAGVELSDSFLKAMESYANLAWAKNSSEMRQLFPLAEKMKAKGLAFNAGYVDDLEGDNSDNESDNSGDHASMEWQNLSKWQPDLARDFHKEIHQKMTPLLTQFEQYIRGDKFIPTDAEELQKLLELEKKSLKALCTDRLGKCSKMEGFQALERLNSEMRQKNDDMHYEQFLGIVPLTDLAGYWCEPLQSGKSENQVQSELLAIWVDFQIPLGWVCKPLETAQDRYPTLEEKKTYYRFKMNTDPETGESLSYDGAGWPQWQTLIMSLQCCSTGISYNAIEGQSDLDHYLHEAGYGDDEMPQKRLQWKDLCQKALQEGPVPKDHAFLVPPKHTSQTAAAGLNLSDADHEAEAQANHGQPSSRSKNQQRYDHTRSSTVWDRESEFERPVNSNEPARRKAILPGGEEELYAWSSARQPRVLPTHPVTFGELKPNHTVMGDLIVAFEKKMTLHDGSEKYRYQYVVDKGDGIKELLSEYRCGGSLVRKQLNENAMPRISGDFHEGKVPDSETLHAIECGVNWVTQPHAPNTAEPSKSSKAVCELWWKEKTPQGEVKVRTAPMWRSHLKAKLGPLVGDSLCAKAFSTGEQDFRTFWEVQQCAFPWIMPRVNPQLLLTDGRQVRRGRFRAPV